MSKLKLINSNGEESFRDTQLMQKVKLITQSHDESQSDWQAEGGANGPSDEDGYCRDNAKSLGQLV